MSIRLFSILSISIALVFSHSALAVTVHTWKDANGVTHFSDAPAPDGVNGNTLKYDDLSTDESTVPQDDFYSIANQWQRLKAERDAAHARREAKAQRLAAERQAADELQAAREVNQQQSYPVVYGPVNRSGLWGAGRLPYGQRGFDRGYRDRSTRVRRGVHPNYYSPFHDRVQPQAIRPKSFSNRPSAYRARSTGGHAGFFVRF